MSIFKACDVRGVYPHEMDEDTARRIGRAVGTILRGKDAVVGGDVRLSTPQLKAAVVEGITSSGCDAADIGIVPTPAFYFAKKKLGAVGGVMVTASHNPPDHNGLKIILGDLPITEAELSQIEELAVHGEFASGAGKQTQVDIIPDYKRFLTSEFGSRMQALGRKARVIIDCGNGCYSEIAPDVFESLGIPFEPLYCVADGTFPNRSPNSADPKNLADLCSAVVRSGADMGIAFDGDGDRVSFVDENGGVLTADQTIGVISSQIGVGSGDRVVLDIKCSSAVAQIVESLGAAPIMEKSGHTFIKTRVIREGAKLGGEISGHLFYGELGGGDDGLYSALLMTHIVSEHGPLSQLAAQVPEYANTPDLRVGIDPDPEVLDTIAAAFPQEAVNRLDGVRVEFGDGWGLARLSITEPLITLRFEAKDEQTLKQIMNDFLSPVPNLKEAVRKLREF